LTLSEGNPLQVAFVWHLHQPDYRDRQQRRFQLPWVRLHALKDYYDMAARLERFENVHQTFNLVPSLMLQLENYLEEGWSEIELDLFLKRASDLTERDKVSMLEMFFNAPEATMISLGDYPLPLVDEDLKNEKGVPENAVKLARQFAAHDGLFIASPEYNASIPPLLKNALDWASLVRDIKPYAGLTVALGAASNGRLGGIRGLYHLRAVLMNVGALVISEQASVSGAADAFGEDGLPTDTRQRAMLEKTCRSLMELSAVQRGQS